MYVAVTSGDVDTCLYGLSAVQYQTLLEIKQQADADINRLRVNVQEAQQQLAMPFYKKSVMVAKVRRLPTNAACHACSTDHQAIVLPKDPMCDGWAAESSLGDATGASDRSSFPTIRVRQRVRCRRRCETQCPDLHGTAPVPGTIEQRPPQEEPLLLVDFDDYIPYPITTPKFIPGFLDSRQR